MKGLLRTGLVSATAALAALLPLGAAASASTLAAPLCGAGCVAPDGTRVTVVSAEAVPYDNVEPNGAYEPNGA